jgi:hypothetical protein
LDAQLRNNLKNTFPSIYIVMFLRKAKLKTE